ncbi:N/A [soil metagenome]
MDRDDPLGPTPHADVNSVLYGFLSTAQSILGQNFRGMYLHGSLSLGDFAPDRSDIDFVVVTDSDVTKNQLVNLQRMHARFDLSDSPWATEVEAAYFPQDALRRYDPANAMHPHIVRGEGTLVVERFDSDWIVNRYVLREHGVTVAGPDPRRLIDPIDPHCLRLAVADIGVSWLEPEFLETDEPRALQLRGYQAYIILTLCRMLYTLEFGTVVSKPHAAHWAQKTLAGHWDDLIEHALTWRKDHQDTPRSDEVARTVALISHTVERCREMSLSPVKPPVG